MENIQQILDEFKEVLEDEGIESAMIVLGVQLRELVESVPDEADYLAIHRGTAVKDVIKINTIQAWKEQQLGKEEDCSHAEYEGIDNCTRCGKALNK